LTTAGWLSLAAICAMGAVSPGPSLALVVRETLAGGRRNGLTAALLHGLGIGLYAFAAIAGLAVLVTRSPALFNGLRYGGAAFLAYLGLRALLARTGPGAALGKPGGEARPAWKSGRDGFLIAFLNPKIAVFFIALFSQFVSPSAGLGEKLGMASLAAGIDAVWYAIVALALSHSAVLERLRRRAGVLDRVLGVVLLALALRVLLLD